MRIIAVTASAALLLAACADLPSAPADSFDPSFAAGGTTVLRVPEDHATIQAAVDAVSSGGMIRVRRGTYAERVVITTPGIRLHAGEGVVLDGSALGGIGVHVLGSAAALISGVEVAGFEVTGFERGVVVQWGDGARVHRNEVHHSLDRTAPLVLGDAIGIDVISSRGSVVSQNRVHHNGDTGIAIRVGSTGSLVHGNWVHANGSQHASLPDGRGILITGAATNDNTVTANEILANNGRGVLVARPANTAPITGNRIAHNRLHGNQRSGVALMGPVTETTVEQNDARDNNLSGRAPCYRCNLADLSVGGNYWRNNLGTFNLADPTCLM